MCDLSRTSLKTINLCSPINKIFKNNTLLKLVNENKNLAPQGSSEWLSMREYNIGGSEMSVITGDNPFSKIDDLVGQKVGFSKFNGNIACRWGKIFENVSHDISKIIFDIDNIYETGSLEGCVKYQRYSPDGLAVIKCNCINENNGTKFFGDQYCIVLFEYKSPFSSIPNGKIANYYLPQVKTGLCSINIADFALFINNMYRKCSFNDLGTNLIYDTEFHSRDAKKKISLENVLSFGINIFYQTPEQNKLFIEKYIDRKEYTETPYNSEISDSDCSEVMDNIFNNVVNIHSLYNYIKNTFNTDGIYRDFGKSYYTEFDLLLKLYDEELISIHICKPIVCDIYYENKFLKLHNKQPKKTIENYKEFYNNEIITFNKKNNPNKAIGFLPWKLFKSDIIHNERDPNYVKLYENEIKKTINIIKDINNSESEFQKIKKFKNYFPESKVLKNNNLEIEDIEFFMPQNM